MEEETDVTSSATIIETLFGRYLPVWQMREAERCTLLMLLRDIEPQCAIEIGTAQGGSLSAIARYSKRVFSLDINASCKETLSPLFPQVVFLTGRSQKTLPPLLTQLEQEKALLQFVLIDGQHTRQGLKADIENLLEFTPTTTLLILIHDSFNPECRQGILEANWTKNPHVQEVEVDFVPGALAIHPPSVYGQMWGGFALALLTTQVRQGEVRLQCSQDLTYQTALLHSISRPRWDYFLLRKFRGALARISK